MPDRKPIIELRQLGKQYGAVRAVAGVDLSVEEGEFVTLLGPSGCGKTTIIRMIAGYVMP
jgi:spermidine/putrescine transport system ATP-binding protein